MNKKGIVIGMLLKGIDEDGKRDLLKTTNNYTTSDQYIDFIKPFCYDICWIKPSTPYDQLKAIMSKINGILLPGGTTNVYKPDPKNKETEIESEYTITVKNILKIAIQINDAGINFPLFGICLGFEALCAACEQGKSMICKYECNNYNATLKYTVPQEESKIMTYFGDDLVEVLSKEPLTYNYHTYYADRQQFEKSDSSKLFKVVAESSSQDGKVNFISIIEGRKYPFYAVQFHPELNRKDYFGSNPLFIPIVSEKTQKMSLSLIKLFVDEAAKNTQVCDGSVLLLSVNPGEPKEVEKGYRFYTWA